MHQVNLSLSKITKVEGSASLDVLVENNRVKEVRFKVDEYKRFYTEAMKGKPIAALPQLLARICGTCSNAHLICSIKACESALNIKPSEQTEILRKLLMYGLNIRDHGLHLYLFSLPDIYGKDSFLDFDEEDKEQHQLLHDGFDVKGAGNLLSILVGGRSVHAPTPTIGGFLKFPEKAEIRETVNKLKKARPAVLRLIEIFENAPFHLDRKTKFMALLPEKTFGYLSGCIGTGEGECIQEENYRDHLEHVVLPYSQASAYKHKGDSYMVGALARINLASNLLNKKTKKSVDKTLKIFPSTDIFHNNLAQAIEVLHCIDDSIDILTTYKFKPEPIIKPQFKEGAVGVGVIEAPRGTLYHKVVLGKNGIVKEGEIVVPTGQNQINIEKDIHQLVESLLPDTQKELIEFEMEKLIRAYDPCMSCAAHFLKVNWKKK